MSAIFFALMEEAKPWIKALSAKPVRNQGHFRSFHTDSHDIVVTGIGKLASSMAVVELAGLLPKSQRHSGYRIWNLGIAGSANKKRAIGEFYWANKISDFSSNRDFYPDMLEECELNSETSVTTFDRAISRNPEADTKYFAILNDEGLSRVDLVDMEASGFFNAASIYFELSTIRVGKIISDHLEGSFCKADFISELMENSVKMLLPYFEISFDPAPANPLDDKEWSQWKNMALCYHFTESMLVDLKKALKYFRLRHPHSIIPSPINHSPGKPLEKRDAKQIFSKWKHALYA